jgi:hypothetical protein
MDDSIRPTPEGNLQPAADDTLAKDRRRPGRVEYDNPALIAILRNPTAGVHADAPELATLPRPAGEWSDEQDDDWRASRGIARGLLFVAPFWVAVALLWRLL